eukprot:354711-Chlamydomonas_euryale.AAC.1
MCPPHPEGGGRLNRRSWGKEKGWAGRKEGATCSLQLAMQFPLQFVMYFAMQFAMQFATQFVTQFTVCHVELPVTLDSDMCKLC